MTGGPHYSNVLHKKSHHISPGSVCIPLFSSRGAMPCAPSLASDRSMAPESRSWSSTRPVSKLSFMVVAMTPVGPLFTQPLQYRPAARGTEPDRTSENPSGPVKTQWNHVTQDLKTQPL